ncbi:MAG: GAF domain-containing protein [Spirochaetota bacterium]
MIFPSLQDKPGDSRAREEQRRSCFLDLLGNVNQAIIHSDSRESLLAEVCRLSVEQAAIDVAWIGMIDAKTGNISTVASYSRAGTTRIPDNLCADDLQSCLCNTDRVVHEGRALVTYNCWEGICSNFIETGLGSSGSRSCASFALCKGGRLFGTLSLVSGQSCILHEVEIALLEEVARILSIALEHFEGDSGKKWDEVKLRESRILNRTIHEASNEFSIVKDQESALESGKVSGTAHEFDSPDHTMHSVLVRNIGCASKEEMSHKLPRVAQDRILQLDSMARYLARAHGSFSTALGILVDVFYGEYSHSRNRYRDILG